MARFVPNNKFTRQVLGIDPLPDSVYELSGLAKKATRALIIANRGGVIRRPDTKENGYIGGETQSKRDTEELAKGRSSEADRGYQYGETNFGEELQGIQRTSEGYREGKTNFHHAPVGLAPNIFQKITIFDLDYEEARDKESRKVRSIQLPFVPRELQYTPDSKFVGISTIGRNNPRYHYTGSEDTLEFTIDWHTIADMERKDVIFNCRWIEALTKADGNQLNPRRVKIIWGTADNLFKDTQWIITKAPYKMNNFQNVHYDKDNTLQNSGMRPAQAYQQVTLKKITDFNLGAKQIINYD